MKRCPECRRDYLDDSLLYCLEDGSALVQGVVPSPDEPQTVILPNASPRPGHHGDSEKNSIAVLPFANLSADPENEYFCDGLAEEILNALAHVDSLKVAARTSAFAFKGQRADVNEIAGKLNVRTVLEGSVRRSGDRLRITAQLINAADGYQLWSERYDRELKDIFDVQDEIALAVVDALKVKLFGKERSAVLKRHTASAEAHEFYLRGISHFNRWTPSDFEKAAENFEKAIAIDENYAPAYAALADTYTELLFFSFSSSDARASARRAAERALQLDDQLAEAHNSLALIRMYFDWDYRGADVEFKRAIELNPGGASIHMWYGWFLGFTGRFDESLRELQRARELDPLAAPNSNAIGVVLHWRGETDRAIEQFRDVLELHPGYPVTLSFLAEAYAKKGDIDAAITTIERIPASAADPQALSVMGYLYAAGGYREKATAIIDQFNQRSRQEYVPSLNFAHIYAGLGENDKALAALEKACDERAIWMPFIKVDVKLEELRSEPRFRDLLGRVGFDS